MQEKVRYFTTGEVSRILGISQRTVKNYCDSGRIICEQTPVTRYRRIPAEALAQFIRENSLPPDLFERLTGRKILIVEDDEIFRDYMYELLSAHFPDVAVETAVDGYDGCLKAVQFMPDLAVIDLKLPREDGVTVCRRLKENAATGTIGIIVVTAFPDKEKKAELNRLGITRVFEKPLAKSAFLASVDELLAVKGPL